MRKREKSIVSIPGILASMVGFNLLIRLHSSMGTKLPIHEAHYYRWKQGNIYYTKEGSGPPILLVHDLDPASSTEEWSKVIPILREKYRVYAIDLIGCGRSDKPKYLYTQFLYDKLLVDFVRNVIGEKTVVIATGSAVPAAVMAAHLDPEPFGKIIGVNPRPVSDCSAVPDLKDRILRLIYSSPIVGTFLYNLRYCKPRVLYEMVNRNYYHPQEADPEIVDLYYRFSHFDHKEAGMLYTSIQSKFMNLDIRLGLADRKPLALIFGSAEEQKERTLAEYTHYGNVTTVKTIPQTAHLPQLEKEEEFADLVANFIDE